MEHEIFVDKFNWNGLTGLQSGKYAEYYTKMEFALYGLEVFVPEIDDRGIDFIVRNKHKQFFEIQVKSLRKFDYVEMKKSTFEISNENLFLVFILLAQKKLPDIFFIPAKEWKEPNALFRDNKDNWGFNVKKENMDILNKYKFNNIIKNIL
jgi:hypothetical protein